ncbi:MAG: polymerase subunit sigma-70 [Nocardioidaceae bacterium]|nr:polymerase subunit sigma-70 [Nocardioidaceae bacterium]
MLRAALAFARAHPHASPRAFGLALSLADTSPHGVSTPGSPGWGRTPDAEAQRLVALVDLARAGDAEAFGQLYDHYVSGIFRFVYYRVGTNALAEDLTSETFTRGLRSIQKFQWQGKDFGAWLTTIARNLIADHYKSSRSRLEYVSDTIPEPKTRASSPEDGVISAISSELLLDAVNQLSSDQRDCVLMRFIQGLSIAQTAEAMQKSDGAIKQLQLRAIRGLGKLISEDLR